MFKRVTFLLLASVVMLAVLPLSMTVSAQNPDCEGDVTLTYWHHWGGNRIPLQEHQVAAFEDAHPGICVDNIFLPWDNRLQNLLAAIAAGNPPDVTMFGRHDLPFFAATESIIPLDDYMAADGVDPAIFHPSEFAGTQFNGKTWLLPLPGGGAFSIAWYNTDHFAEAGIESFPETWDEMLEVAETLRLGDGSFLERIGVNTQSTSGPGAFLTWLNANGQDWISADLRTITINNEAGIQALQFMQDMAEINYGIEELNAFWEMAGEFDQGPLIQGLVSIEINGSWTLFQVEDHAENLNYDVAPIPYGPMGDPGRRGGAHGGWGYMIPKNAAHPDEAWKLVKWLTTEIEGDGACWFIQQQQRPSPLIDCNGYEKDGVVHPRAESLLGVAALDNLVTVSPVQPEANQIINRMVEDVLFGDSSIEDALASAEGEIQGLLDAFWEEYG
ncbi:MAG: ABC transporter substrate-binding protein [Chloroflexota bacterium]|nr:ABC transporter substrate-binding protein [Chloroflexota bacterium]MDE2950636.1 ABC transporter substrate-binding protein [Chloroflexota bacterium]